MPHKLLSRIWEFETSDHIAVGAMEIDITQKSMFERTAFTSGRLRSDGLVLTFENNPELHSNE